MKGTAVKSRAQLKTHDVVDYKAVLKVHSALKVYFLTLVWNTESQCWVCTLRK